MRIAIVGATGAVGQEMCAILQARGFPAARLSLYASARSAGRQVSYDGAHLPVKSLEHDRYDGAEIALLSAGSAASKRWAPGLIAGGAVIIDNSSAFRMDETVPLVIPEVNPQDAHHHRGIIANPNCSTIIMAVAVWPLHQHNRVRRIVASTYQAISGAGATAMQELLDQTRDVLAHKPPVSKVLAHPAAFNLFSHDSAIDDSGYNEEERKMVRETHKMFHDPDIQISATCVRVPVLRAHSESLSLTFERPIRPAEVREILSAAPGIRLVDDPQRNHFPMPIEASGQDDVLVGRIRSDASDPTGCGIVLFVSGDQLRKGAALNAIQIADLLNGRG